MINEELKQKLAEAQAARVDEEDMLDSGGESREDLMTAKAELEAEMKMLSSELAAYSNDDPTELERKSGEANALKAEAEEYTDQIQSMSGWFKEMLAGDDEALEAFRQTFYGDEYDEEDGDLRELA